MGIFLKRHCRKDIGKKNTLKVKIKKTFNKIPATTATTAAITTVASTILTPIPIRIPLYVTKPQTESTSVPAATTTK